MFIAQQVINLLHLWISKHIARWTYYIHHANEYSIFIARCVYCSINVAYLSRKSKYSIYSVVNAVHQLRAKHTFLLHDKYSIHRIICAINIQYSSRKKYQIMSYLLREVSSVQENKTQI